MFKSMLFYLFFFSCCFAQLVEESLNLSYNQDDNNIFGSGDELMALSSPPSKDGNHVKEILNIIADMKNEMVELKEKISRNEEQIDYLGTRGFWCGFQNEWHTASSTITYDLLNFSGSNMKIAVTPLDIETG